MKTVSVELAKQLKKAGYPQESYFIWKNFGIVKEQWQLYQTAGLLAEEENAAPTADEILNRLPRWCVRQKNKHELIIRKSGVDEFPWWIGYKSYFEQTGESLVDAAAKTWLFLKKEGLL